MIVRLVNEEVEEIQALVIARGTPVIFETAEGKAVINQGIMCPVRSLETVTLHGGDKYSSHAVNSDFFCRGYCLHFLFGLCYCSRVDKGFYLT